MTSAIRSAGYDVPMTNNTMTSSTNPPLDLPMSVFEVMGDETLGLLREHAAGVLAACSPTAKIRREAPEVAEHLDAIGVVLEEHLLEVFEALAAIAGVPGEGQSLSRGAGAPRHGDYRVIAGGCWVWMRTLNSRGYPELGRRSKYRHNRPAILYWMLVHGPLPEGMRLERTCGERLCINPAHGKLSTRSEQGARVMRERSPLDWDAVREIRRAIPTGEDPDILAERFGVSRHSIMDVFRNVSWHDPEYHPGVERRCSGCSMTFETTNLVRRYCTGDCMRKAFAQRQRRRRGDCEPTLRQLRDRDRLRSEMDAATAEYGPLLDQEVRPTWGRSLDAALGETRQTLHDMLADSNADDPAAAAEAAYVREVLEGLTEDQIPHLADEEVLALQDRCHEAGLLPQTSSAVT